jgi:hypothetical protein
MVYRAQSLLVGLCVPHSVAFHLHSILNVICPAISVHEVQPSHAHLAITQYVVLSFVVLITAGAIAMKVGLTINLKPNASCLAEHTCIYMHLVIAALIIGHIKPVPYYSLHFALQLCDARVEPECMRRARCTLMDGALDTPALRLRLLHSFSLHHNKAYTSLAATIKALQRIALVARVTSTCLCNILCHAIIKQMHWAPDLQTCNTSPELSDHLNEWRRYSEWTVFT